MIKQLLITATLFLMGTNLLQAHPGHEHTAATSGLEHALFYLSILSVFAVAYYAITKMTKKSSSKVKGEK